MDPQLSIYQSGILITVAGITPSKLNQVSRVLELNPEGAVEADVGMQQFAQAQGFAQETILQEHTILVQSKPQIVEDIRSAHGKSKQTHIAYSFARRCCFTSHGYPRIHRRWCWCGGWRAFLGGDGCVGS